MTTCRLSIDFGTTNTAAAYRDASGSIREIRLSASSNLMSSAVFADTMELIVGSAAHNLAAVEPAAFEPNPKRRLRDDVVLIRDRELRSTELAAAVLRQVWDTATRVAGATFSEIILTHPDSWAGHLKAQLSEAATLAGIPRERITLVTEAQAAAMYYSARDDTASESRICVFDFGAGTCDVAVLDLSATGAYTVAASDGLDFLGGNDLDSRVLDWVYDRITALPEDVKQFASTPAGRLSLIDRSRDAKETLSSATKAHIPVTGGSALQLTRSEFETLIHHDVTRCAEFTEQVIGRAQQTAERPVSCIYLVGGSSHIPLIHRELGKLAPLATLGDPKTVVVQGALRVDPQPDSSRESPPGAHVMIPSTSGVITDLVFRTQPNARITAGGVIATGRLPHGEVTLHSPVGGVIRTLGPRPGEFASPGDLLATIAPQVVPAAALTRLRPMPAEIRLGTATPTPPPDAESRHHEILDNQRTTVSRPRRNRLPIAIGVTVVALIALVGVVVAVKPFGNPLEASSSGSPTSTEEAVSISKTSTGELTYTGDSNCSLAGTNEILGTDCYMLSMIPTEVQAATSCELLSDDYRYGALRAVGCTLPSNSSAPYFDVHVYDFSTAAEADDLTFGFDAATAKEFPEPDSMFLGDDGTRVFSLASSTNSGTSMLCSTRKVSPYATCIFYASAAMSPQGALDWWRDQPHL